MSIMRICAIGVPLIVLIYFKIKNMSINENNLFRINELTMPISLY